MINDLEKQQILKLLREAEDKLETFRSQLNDSIANSENMFSDQWWAVGAWEDAKGLANIMDSILFWKEANELRVNSSEEVNEPLPVSEIQNLTISDRLAVAENSNTPIETLKVLSKDKDWEVRRAVAKNPNTPIETLKVLSKDKSWVVRRAVAENPSTSIEILEYLRKDEKWYVRDALAGNPNWSE